MSEMIVLSTQINKMVLILIGISVDIKLGIEAEKNKTAETLVTAIVNFVIIDAEVTSNVGRNISAISIAAAFAANIGSGIHNILVNG